MILHLLKKELRRHLWLILLLWLVLVFGDSAELVYLISMAVAARLALGDHLTRPTSHWRTKPVSLRDWILSRSAFFTLVFVLPLLIQQGWVAHQTGFSVANSFWAALEVTFTVLIMALSAFVAASLVKSWTGTVLVLLGAMLFLSLTGLLGSTISFPSQLPDGVRWASQAEWFPRTSPWWAFYLGSLIAAGAILFLREKRRASVLPFALAALLFFGCSFLHHEASRLNARFHPVGVDQPAQLSETAATQESDYPLFADLAVQNVDSNQFLTVWRMEGYGKSVHKTPKDFPDQQRHRRWHRSREALMRVIPATHTVIDTNFSNTPSQPTRTVRDAFGDPTIQSIWVAGEVYEWKKLGEMPFRDSRIQLKREYAARLKERGSSRGLSRRRDFVLTLTKPLLKLSPDVHASRLTGMGRSSGRYAYLATNDSLQESIILGISEMHPSAMITTFTYDRSLSTHLTISANQNWDILWPDGNPVEEWIKGARLEIYGQEVVGKVDSQIDLTTK